MISNPLGGSDISREYADIRKLVFGSEYDKNPGTLNKVKEFCENPDSSNLCEVKTLYQERFIELSFEGHRWFDIVRTGNAATIMGAVAGSNFESTDVLMPIPQRDIQQNPNLTQNPGY